MSFTNQEFATALENIADELEVQEDNPYRVRAYRRAANALKRYDKNIADMMARDEDLTTIPHVGVRISSTLKAMAASGKLDWLPSYKPATVLPANSKIKISKSRGFKIYNTAKVIEKILTELKQLPEVQKIECAGEYRRRKELISSVDILVATTHPEKVFAEFHKLRALKHIVSVDANSTLVQLKLGLYITLHAVSTKDFAAKLLKFTGSFEHYADLQQRAHKKKLTLNDQGILKSGKLLPNKSEEDIYKLLGLSFIPPVLRENRGEIIAAAQAKLPRLVELKDIKGDLHSHTNETDGFNTLEEMVEAARSHDYEYVAVTDHSQSLKITNGMNEKRLLKQIEKINYLNSTMKDFVILKSMEIDILEDGSLDLSTEVLKELDLTVCSVHSKFKLPLEQQTARIIKAMDNPYFNILGHATGRLLNHRPPYQIDLTRILQAAKERNCFIEVNAQPARLDINDIYCKQAKEMGVKVAISSDAHTTNGFNFMILGVNQARRGWLEPKDVINTYRLTALRKLLKRT